MIERALLLAAGFGTRLRPLTDSVPKCLVEIQGQPLMAYWFDQLRASGVGRFVVNTHYLPEQVRGYVQGLSFASEVTLAHEETLLGTGGTLLAHKDFLQGKDSLVAHADNLCLCDFDAFFAAHRQRPKDCLMTMMLFQTETPQSCGIVELDGERLVAFHEKVANPPGNLANAAVYCLGEDFIDWYVEFAQNRKDIDISNDVIPALMGRIHTWENKNYMRDIGTPESYGQAQRDMAARNSA